MANYNKVILMGNLTRDPQMRYLPSQTPVVDFGLAVNRRFKTQSGESKEETTFVDCSAFGRTAEIINQYVHKGNMLFVEGRLRYETWEDKQGGGKRNKLSVHVENVQLMPRSTAPRVAVAVVVKSNRHLAARRIVRRSRDRPAPQQSAPAPEQPYGDEQQFQEDDIPF